MDYEVQISSFEGPLDLLLQLVEAQKLDISEVSLVEVTEPFIAHIRAAQGTIPPQVLADFLLVAAKLVYLKAKSLVPTITDPELEEGPDLATQLKMYQVFVQAATRLGMLAKEARTSFSRAKPLVLAPQTSFRPPPLLTTTALCDAYRTLIRRLEPLARLPRAAIDRVVSLEEKMARLSERLKRAKHVSFNSFLAESDTRLEMAVSFLALLELVRQRIVTVEQTELFSEIRLHSSEIPSSSTYV